MSATALVRYDAMCTAIAAAYAVDEVKDIRDKALALERYAAQARNVEAERQACEIRLRAERRAGQLLRETEKAKGGRPTETGNTVLPVSDRSTLDDLGVSKKQSSDWQKLATVPDNDFEFALKAPTKPTTNGIIAAHAPPSQSPGAVARRAVEAVDPSAMWLWGRLRDFERDGLLAMLDPADLLTSMTLEMRADMARLVPRVVRFLEQMK